MLGLLLRCTQDQSLSFSHLTRLTAHLQSAAMAEQASYSQEVKQLVENLDAIFDFFRNGSMLSGVLV